MSTTLKIVDATLSGLDGVWSIAIQGDWITEVAPQIHTPAQQTLNARGRLVIPGLVDGHIHLDKALLLNQCPAQTGTFQEALTETSKLKRSFTVEDIQARARQVIEREIRSCYETTSRFAPERGLKVTFQAC